jgi:RNA recognition motif-containing protein
MNIYVGNLNYKVDEEKIKEAFAEFGSVDSVKIIQDKMSGRSKGFGFVEMHDDDEAQQAIDNLNQKELMGRKLVVNPAHPKD